MVVRPVQPNWTIQKVADEGSSSPLMARLMIGMLDLRDTVLDHTNRDAFDKPYGLRPEVAFQRKGCHASADEGVAGARAQSRGW